MTDQRFLISTVAPDGYRAVRGLEEYIQANVEHRLLELVKVRASMLNGCAFCVDMHSRDALAAGKTAGGCSLCRRGENRRSSPRTSGRCWSSLTR